MEEVEFANPKLLRKTHEAVLRIKKATGLPIPAIYDAAVGYWESKRLKKFTRELACSASQSGQ